MVHTFTSLLGHFSSFLTAYVHTLLYLRALYPPASFIRARFHNTPVYQSRHPAVCHWILDAISAVKSELLAGTVARIAIVVYSHDSSRKGGSVDIMERYMFDVSTFPRLSKDERNLPMDWEDAVDEEEENAEADAEADDTKTEEDLPQDLAEQFRAALVLLTTQCSRLAPLPKNCSFNISMELRDEADVDPPLGHPQLWIPVQSSLQKTGRKGAENKNQQGRQEGKDLGGARVVPIRNVEAGVLNWDMWIEEGKAKPDMQTTGASTNVGTHQGSSSR
ncbi:DNA-binding protein [Sporormia fimetaria CBS 119925]|uniref:DNA-binding protein n=1 Tax=Sporormia fimetaria CBS 119925 TaxID=1340428 RepID=A0A6A6VC06_9PLEO|nr:DNA-binding protein [Sporormia fimetaria CBS 119925]